MLRANQVESWEGIKDGVLLEMRSYHTFVRAHGDCLCGCGHPLWRHGQPLKETCPTMVQDCEGNWWKL
jgi:hypothetical protein